MATTEVTIWELIIRPQVGPMTPETAKQILGFSIPSSERVRMKALLAKAKTGDLSREETLELDACERAGNMLSILKAKARRLLKSQKN